MLHFLLLTLILAVAAIGLIRHIESRSIFFPMKGRPALTGSALPHEEVHFTAADGVRLHGWLVPHKNRGAVALFLHGNAGNIGHRWDKVRILHDIGIPVFIFDYRGYGLSEGRPSETGIRRDVDAAIALLAERGHPASSVIVYGESIGGAFAVDLASRADVAALIVEDSFTSIPAMVRRSMPLIPVFALATRLDSLAKIPRVRAPKLIFHSVDDEIVPFEMGEELFGAAAEPKIFVRLRGGHNTAFFDDLKTYRSGLADFIRSIPPS